jgi:hypothetical protein
MTCQGTSHGFPLLVSIQPTKDALAYSCRRPWCGLGAQFTLLVTKFSSLCPCLTSPAGATAPQLGQALLSAVRHEAGDVRQSGFALVGDLAQGCVSFLTPLVPDLVAAALTCLAPNNINQVGCKDCACAAAPCYVAPMLCFLVACCVEVAMGLLVQVICCCS